MISGFNYKLLAGSLVLGFAFVSIPIFAETIKTEKNIMNSSSLEQRGKQLYAEVEQVWNKIQATPELLQLSNDISETVAKYFPIGTSFENAEIILRSAGFNILPRPNPNFPSNYPNNYDLITTMVLEKSWFHEVLVTIVLSPETPDTHQSKVKRAKGTIINSSL